MILCFETATSVCSVALCDTSGIISLKESRENKSHAAQLTLFVDDILNSAGLEARDLDAVAVSKGPGSYTGLRIGVSVAKGIAYAASIPLIGIDTTKSMFYGIIDGANEKYGTDNNSYFCPMLDAKRMEVYYSVFDAKGKTIKEISAAVLDEDSFTDIPESVKILFFGDGSAKCNGIVKHKNTIIAKDFEISASFMYRPVYEAFNKLRFEDIAYFEPFYLKDFIATVPKKNILI
jgi:tRNA threonylcarbamoyladenosine biosynthesis protein TsaB